MIDPIDIKSIVSAAARFTQRLALAMLAAQAVRLGVRYATEPPIVSARVTLAVPAARLEPMTECQSCKEDRAKKRPPLPPMERIKLPAEITSAGFRRPRLGIYVCAWCDGEDLVTGALTRSKARQAEEPQAE